MRHSICPKCVRSPRVKRYRSFATLFRLQGSTAGQQISRCASRKVTSYLTPGSPLSSLKLVRIAALSFWITALSSAIVFAARTLRMNCFTEIRISHIQFLAASMSHKSSLASASGSPGGSARLTEEFWCLYDNPKPLAFRHLHWLRLRLRHRSMVYPCPVALNT